MGMDLIPVFEDAGSADDPAGTVRISPWSTTWEFAPSRHQGRLPNTITTVGYVQYEDEMAHVHPRVGLDRSALRES